MEKAFYEGAVYHLQQSAVKNLKALEFHRGISTNVFTGVKLLESLAANGLNTEHVVNFARKLDLFYSDSRFPTNGPISSKFDETMIVELFVCLERIQAFCNENMK